MEELIRELNNNFKWLTLNYKDGSQKHIYTTTNEERCRLHGLQFNHYETYLYDFRLEEWFDISKAIGYELSDNLVNKGTTLSRALYDYI